MPRFPRPTSCLAALAAGSALLAGCGSDAETKSAAPSYLFSFQGDNASMTPAAGDASKFTFRLPVDSRSKFVTWFTDRPQRDAGVMNLADFVALWNRGGNNGFKSDPPNVSIIYGTDSKPLTMIAIMSGAKIVHSGSGDQLEATMTVVPEATRAAFAESDAHLAAHAKRASGPATPPSAALTKTIAVFVDPEVGVTDS